METAALARARSGVGEPIGCASGEESFQGLMAGVQSAEAFIAGLEAIIAGLRQSQMAPGGRASGQR